MSFEKALADEIKRLKVRLDALVGLSRTPLAHRKKGKAPKVAPAPRKPKRKLSSKVRAQRKLQGAYMGHVRRLNPVQKKQISEIRAKSGYPKAIAAAKKLSSKS